MTWFNEKRPYWFLCISPTLCAVCVPWFYIGIANGAPDFNPYGGCLPYKWRGIRAAWGKMPYVEGGNMFRHRDHFLSQTYKGWL